MKIGDLLFFKGGWGHYNPDFPTGIGHVGIYVGGDKVINARYQRNKDGSDDGSVMNYHGFTAVVSSGYAFGEYVIVQFTHG